MLHFGRADTVRQTAERAMRRSMRITADNRHAGKRRPLFRPDDMYNALAFVGHIEIRQAICFCIVVQRFDLKTRNRIGNGTIPVLCGNIMIGYQQIG